MPLRLPEKFTNGFRYRLRFSDDKPTRLKEYRAPSWSWASTDGQLYLRGWDKDDEHETELACEVVEISTTLKDAAFPYGEVVHGRLTLRGKVRQGWLIKYIDEDGDEDRTIVWDSEITNSGNKAEAYLLNWIKENQELEETYATARYEKHDERHLVEARLDIIEDHQPILVTCFQLVRDFGIILVPENGKGTFKRIGSLGFHPYTSKNDFAAQKMEVITII